jgi:hypothetical protein
VWWSNTKRIPGGTATGPRVGTALRSLVTASGDNPVCCDRPMEQRFVHARDPFGETMFVAVWRCVICGRLAQ